MQRSLCGGLVLLPSQRPPEPRPAVRVLPRTTAAHVPLSTSADNKPVQGLALSKSPCLASRTGATTYLYATASRYVGRARCAVPCSTANRSARHWLVSLSKTSR